MNLGQLNVVQAQVDAFAIQVQGLHFGESGPVLMGGGNVQVNTQGGVAVGGNAQIDDATNAVALGTDAAVTAADAVALGHGSVADQANTVSVGSGDNQRRVVHVAAGTQATDAVNKRQMDVGDAHTLSEAQAYSDAQVIAAGAITPDQVQERINAGNTDTLSAAHAYTDLKMALPMAAIDDLRGEVTQRFDVQDERISQIGAMGTAMSAMAMNTAGLTGRNRVGVGVGTMEGEQALSVGYQRVIGGSGRASISLGAAFGGGESSIGAGAGFSW